MPNVQRRRTGKKVEPVSTKRQVIEYVKTFKLSNRELILLILFMLFGFSTDVPKVDTPENEVVEAGILSKDKVISIDKIITDPNVLEYVTHNQVLQRAANISKITNLNVSTIIGQKGLESNWNRSKLCLRTKNQGNIKCFNKACKKYNWKIRKGQYGSETSHCIQYFDDCQSDRFLKYNSYQEGWDAYENLIKKRYSKAGTKKSSKKQLQIIKDNGYATNKNYVSIINNVIEKSGLKKLDYYIQNGYTITSKTGKYVFYKN